MGLFSEFAFSTKTSSVAADGRLAPRGALGERVSRISAGRSRLRLGGHFPSSAGLGFDSNILTSYVLISQKYSLKSFVEE